MSVQASSTWRERLTSPVTWHAAGAAVLAVVAIGLGVRFAMDWIATSGSSTDALKAKQVQLKALDLETAPLRGLDKKAVEARKQIDKFYADRIPPSYSAISTRIGELEVDSGVRLSRMQYTQGPPGSDLTEITLDAGISGEYPQIMRFINGLERDKDFFVIRAMALTSQQGGLVNLRLRVSTWLRPADAEASGLPLTPTQGNPPVAPGPAVSGPAVPGKEGE
jgi:type IV pilus assembly protein PilO